MEIHARRIDCLKGAPDTYGYVMQCLHILTFPIYTLAFILLIAKSPQPLKEYRNYLLWHTAGNLVFEIYVSVFMLPVTYLPAPVLRGSGLVKYFDLSGVAQFYVLVLCLVHTGLTILEMLKYRFDALISEESFNKKLIHRSLLVFYFVAVMIPLLGFSLLSICVPEQIIYKEMYIKKNPDVSIEIICNTAAIAPPILNPVFTPIMSLITIAVLIACTTVPYIFYVLLKKLDEIKRSLSNKTVQLQRMLLISLFIQTAIHGIMLAVPVIGFVYAILFTVSYNSFGFVLLILMSIHGSISTMAMLGFTKPLRKAFFDIVTPRKLSHKVPILIFPLETSITSHTLHVISN